MDPQRAWQELVDAFHELDWDRVDELADGLLHWMQRGGFPPETSPPTKAVDGFGHEPPRSLGHDWNRAVAVAACDYARNLARLVLDAPNGIPQGVPFILSCSDCDIDSPVSYAEAVAAGWTCIRFVPQSLAENFLGLCPDCQQVGEVIP